MSKLTEQELLAEIQHLKQERDEARCLVAACWKALDGDENYGAMVTLHDMLAEVEWLKK